MTKPTIICLTPVKNEAWVLNRFLACASLWADHIIVADQKSTDGSREIAQSFSKVTLIDNPSPTFNEPERQKLLLDAARNIPGPRFIVALDADEILTGNYTQSPEWKTILESPMGTVVHFQWIHLMPGLRTFWIYPGYYPMGFMDDGSDHSGHIIHSPRIPTPPHGRKIFLHDIGVLHYQYTDWKRMKSKQRWYQCWERINRPQKHVIDVYRKYHGMDGINPKEVHKVDKAWFSCYEKHGIDMTSIQHDRPFWWDQEVLQWFNEYGTKKFRKEAIWETNWSSLAKQENQNQCQDYSDPRHLFERLIHRWLRKTQPYYKRLHVRLIHRLLKLLHW